MHIMEGYLPWEWCLVWFLAAVPFLFFGARKIIKIVRDNPEQKMTVALSGAFMFLLSSLKLPSVTGSSSHPTGTGLSTVLYGIACTSFLAAIVLIFQTLLLAHGGLTTLGANIVSMGIFGPACGFAVWHLLRSMRLSIPISMFSAAMSANILTYVMTSLQLALAYHDIGFLTAFSEFLAVFALTQIPLAIIEGMIFAMFAMYLVNNKPEIFGGAAGINAAGGREKC
ncbi:MAG: energy-coupling factor ABC transporter permease [Candidatus Methanoplasma sp.]|jgi:cobalt/nickel transport system permease protein|nr:energy-coupling factor ABC transporter permease [Candidatus Methanoplasma sp.]